LSSPRLIAIGASAGGVEALRTVVTALPQDFPAALLIVLHIPANRTSLLPEILSRGSRIPVGHALDGEKLRPGRVYVAPPDDHLLVDKDRLRLLHGPRENGHRPAIDPLFRSLANSATDPIGVILSGTLDDGTAGLAAIKEAGGLALVQDPADATYSDMPRSAIENVAVDKILPADQIAPQLAAWLAAPSNGSSRRRRRILSRKPASASEDGSPRQHAPSAFTCPDCNGTLWEGKTGSLTRFVCRVGHSYTLDALENKKTDDLEAALWVSVRTLEERADLQRRLAAQARGRNHHQISRGFEKRSHEMAVHALTIRRLLEQDGQTSIARKKAHR
jgi:two-component system, chemotaxis family, protein-glutamate methylesterase/glutaminase